MNNKKTSNIKINEIIAILSYEKERFFRGLLNKEEESIFIKLLDLLHQQKNIITDTDLKIKVNDLLKVLMKHKNYKIFKTYQLLQKKQEEKLLRRELEKKELRREIEAQIEIVKNNFISLDTQDLVNKIVKYSNFSEFCSEFDDLLLYVKEKQEILDFLNERKIQYLMHFTTVKNLRSILDNGLLPIEELKKQNIQFKQNDSLRKDERTDCVNLSIEFPNSYLLSKYKRKYFNENWCIIILDAKEVLLNNDNIKYYTYCNAASKNAKDCLSRENLTKSIHLKRLFYETNPDERFSNYTRMGKQLKPYLPTNEQSEILFKGNIPKIYFKKIIFETEIVLNNFKNDGLIDIELDFNDLLFQCNRDSITWEER